MTGSEQPLPDIDHLPIGALATRVRSLDAEGLTAVLDHEREHAARPAVLQILEQRLAEVQGGAEPTGGDVTAPDPATGQAPQGGSQVSPQTQGPSINPPSHGDPTNPAQPRG